MRRKFFELPADSLPPMLNVLVRSKNAVSLTARGAGRGGALRLVAFHEGFRYSFGHDCCSSSGKISSVF